MLNLLSQNELCYSIFSIKFDDHSQFSSLRPKIKSLIPKGKFPIINFKRYQSDYKNHVDFFILLQKYSFSFPFDKEFLDFFSKPENQPINETVTSPDYIVLIILHSFISWYINFVKNHSTENIIIILRCLLIIMNIKNCKVVTKSRSYAASAFMNVYSEIVESDYITNITEIFPPIVEFLTINIDLPPSAFDLLLKLGNRVIDPNSSKLTKDMSHFVNFVVIIIRTCGNRCPSHITSVIVSLLSKSLIGLDKDALLFFSRSIKSLGIETSVSIVSEWPDSILSKITENESPIFACNSKRDENLVFPASDAKFDFKLVNHSTFETDIRNLITIPLDFPELLPPKELISPDLLEIFQLICSIVDNNNELIEILIKKICSILTSASLTPHFYDINSAFLYLLLILTSKNLLIKKFPKDIFLSNLFDQNETVFKHGDDFQKINTIRHIVFLLLINQSHETIFDSLMVIRLKPYIFAEFIYRFLPNFVNLGKILDIAVPVFEAVMSSCIYYLNFQEISVEMKKAACDARIACFSCIDIMLKIPDFRKKFFESSLCVDAMISLVFEKSVRNWALLRIIDAYYLENTSFDYLTKSCLNLFQITCNFGFSKSEILQVESLIRFLDNKFFTPTNKIEVMKRFEVVLSDICRWMANLIKNAWKSIEKPLSVPLSAISIKSSDERPNFKSPQANSNPKIDNNEGNRPRFKTISSGSHHFIESPVNSNAEDKNRESPSSVRRHRRRSNTSSESSPNKNENANTPLESNIDFKEKSSPRGQKHRLSDGSNVSPRSHSRSPSTPRTKPSKTLESKTPKQSSKDDTFSTPRYNNTKRVKIIKQQQLPSPSNEQKIDNPNTQSEPVLKPEKVIDSSKTPPSILVSSNSNLKTLTTTPAHHFTTNLRAYYVHLLNKLLNILTRFSAVHSISQSDISVIDTSARFLYKNNPNNDFFIHLLRLISGEFLQSTDPNFDIRQPKAMRLIISLFDKSHSFLEKIDYIIALCKYSTINCEQLQKGEFDLFLVGYLISLRNDPNIEKEVFTKLLLILRLISEHSSSVAFVHQYVSLLSPINCRIIPRFQQEVIDSMQTLLQDSGKVPATPLPIISTTKVTAENIHLTTSFTVFFWFFMYSNDEPIIIVDITNENRKLMIQFVHERISVFLQNKPNQWNGESTYDLPLNQWSLATFSVLADSEKNRVTVMPAVNGVILSVTIFPYFDFSNCLSQVDVGITKSDKISVLLGSFGITKYFDPSINISLLDAGPRRVPSTPLFFFNCHNKNDIFEIEAIPPNVNASIQKVRSLHKPSFTDILIEICGVSILIPLLVNIDLTFDSGQRLPFLLEQFIEILEMSLTLSNNTQRLFASEKGFLIISNLIHSLDYAELNYRTYLRFVSLFELLDNQKCRSQLLFGILMKFDLWIRCDSLNLKKILRYMDFSLIPSNLDFVMKKIKFNNIITALRIYFWYNPVEVDTILHLEDRLIYEKNDIHTCRNHLLSIAFMMSYQGLTNEEFKFLISQILSLEDKEQIIDLLHFTNDLIDNHEIITQKSERVYESIIYLLFSYSTEIEVFELSINLVLKCYKNSLIKEINIPNYFEVIMHQLPSCYGHLPIYNKLLEICKKKEPKLYSLCSMIAFSLGMDSFTLLLDTLNPNVLFCSTPTWSLWSVISLYKFNDSTFQDRLINFLISISPQQWKNIFWTIDNVGRAFQADHESLKKKFIIDISNSMLKYDDFDQMTLHCYFKLIPQYLFLRSYFRHNEYLYSTYLQEISSKKTVTRKSKSNEEPPSKSYQRNRSELIPAVRARPRVPRLSNFESRLKKTRGSQISYGKRSSFHSIDTLNLFTSQEKFMNLSFIVLKMSDLISMFKSATDKKNFYIYFGLRINEENVWEDIEIARMANELFRKFPNNIYYDSCLFINAFMLHYDPENAIQTVGCIKVTNEQSMPFEYSLYNKHADMLQISKIVDEPASSYFLRSYQFLQQYEDLYHQSKSLTDIYKTLEKNSEKANQLNHIFESEITQISTEIIADFKENLSLRNTKYSKFWTHFWRAMTIGRAPWRAALSEFQKNKDIYFKRDFILCSSLCPFRLRPNFNFDDHKKAAQKRDKGSKCRRENDSPLCPGGTMISLLSSAGTMSQTKSLFSMSNILESYTEFSLEQAKIFNTNDEIEENSASYITESSKCVFESACEIITVSHHYDALFSLQKECFVITKSDQTAYTVKNEHIIAIFQRTQLHRETAIEIILDDGISYFVNFPEIASSEIIKQFKTLKKSLNKLLFLQTQPSKQFTTFSKSTLLWQNKKITNFEYLMILNMISGRSFNDPSQYPLMPWVLKDYTSTTIDFNNEEIYRDLSKPVGLLNQEKFDAIKHSMEDMEYLYSSGNISPLVVFHYLVRVEPFTTLQIREQDEQFDAPDRQFQSINGSYNSILTLSSDFRELIPEFYFLPEFLVNLNNFDFGISNGKKINDVELPNWIKKDASKSPIVSAFEFIYLHRKALESKYVSSHLNEWIDLIWGDKSRGQKAIESNNVYLPEMYPEIWESNAKNEMSDEVTKIESILSYVGQIPIQLFDKPHPQRCNNVDKSILETTIFYQINNNSKINIGTIICLNDRTVALLTIDENGTCMEHDVDINELVKSNEIEETPEVSPIPTSPGKPKIRKTSSQKFISSLNLNEADIKLSNNHFSTEISSMNYQTIEKGISHFNPTKFNESIWKPAFCTYPSNCLFGSSNGFPSFNPSQQQNIGNCSPNLWKKFFIVDSLQKSDLYLVNPHNGQSKRVVRQRNDITAISTDGLEWLAVANKDSKIYLYSLDNIGNSHSGHSKNEVNYLLKVEFSIPSFRDYVKCCFISPNFHALVCGTRDNSLMFCSMTSHSVIKIVEMEAKPILLSITPGWGFCAVYARAISEGNLSHFLEIYSINGFLIRKVEIENPVKKITTWKDENGIDFVALSDSKNRVFCFEAFYCIVDKPIFESSSNIIDISYLESKSAVVVLCENGQTVFIPSSLN